MLDVVLHDLRARLVAALLGEKRCAAVDTALLRGNRVQQALGVRGHGALRVADQRRGGGVGLEAAALPQVHSSPFSAMTMWPISLAAPV